ncbi:MAG: MmcQ/YjbR family DNA-binding protein [Prevotella sp.]|jgi:predicted DNA-binding protein (MmcQ/YjbR family)|nr:MmcQ/YjbR family DNA-binding protein [Prevotella sp.]
MDIETLREHCLSVKGAEECFPFDDTVLVFKIMGKMFAYISLNPGADGFFVNLKCDPERSLELRERYAGIVRGYHAGNSLMWNSVYIESDVPARLIVELIAHSVDEVIKKLPKKQQELYRRMCNEND